MNIYNNLDFPMEQIMHPLNANTVDQEKSTIDFNHNLFPKTNEMIMEQQSNIENQDEDDKLIYNFAKSSDNKVKVQMVKKLVSIYKKYKHNKEKTNVYLTKLANGIQKPIIEITVIIFRSN